MFRGNACEMPVKTKGHPLRFQRESPSQFYQFPSHVQKEWLSKPKAIPLDFKGIPLHDSSNFL